MAPTTAADLNEEKVLTILHFNDVYNIESGTQEPVGGAARFLTALKSYAHLEPMILFSGDIFAPSFSKNFVFDYVSLFIGHRNFYFVDLMFYSVVFKSTILFSRIVEQLREVSGLSK